MKIHFDEDDEVTFDMKSNEGEEEYRIVGTNFRKLTSADTGESESFWIIAEQNNPFDKFAVRVENNNHTHVGYLSKKDNRFWYEILIRCCGGKTSAMKCRGFIGRYYNDDDELTYYGKVFLPRKDDEERPEVKVMGCKEVDELRRRGMEKQGTENRQQVKKAENTKKRKTVRSIMAVLMIAICVATLYAVNSNPTEPSTKESATDSAEREIRSFISLNAPEIEWCHFENNICYLGFSEWDIDNVSLICDIIAARGNKLTNFGFHVWATSSKMYPQYSTKIMDDWGYKYETTYRYGKKED